jgi:hypothetical protein
MTETTGYEVMGIATLNLPTSLRNCRRIACRMG